ncbi:lectin-like protein LEC [Olea europaea var. sylvestris]|uniref:lectin-like protein LEC n=1 Tax=Olea europaea var. sylvestris TaxID=158386 RepID=UPI000C1D4C77|nr:lectin-like protein LEC [Olea europaea var. sylvestris]XP_022857072.1 lectin-like protein LEC [Olea europaea var. sylvestris]
MASNLVFRYFMAFFLVNLYLKVVAADLNLSFSFKNIGKDSEEFESQIAMYGDARVANDSIQISGSGVSSSGRVIYKKPVKLVEGNPINMLSFSMNFVFSTSSENGDGLAFIIVPASFPVDVFDGGSMGLLGERKMRFLAVEFDTFKDEKWGDVNGNHVGIDIDSLVSVKVSNVSSINLVLNNAEKLEAWIDYEANSKRIELRLSKLGVVRPVEPFLSYPIDLSQMWGKEDVLVGLSSSSGNSSQKCNVHSWSFRSRTFPHWMHSEPVDPESFVEKGSELNVRKRSGCTLRIIAALIFGTGCGALGALIVLFVWTIFANRRPVVPEDYAVKPKEYALQPKVFEYKKFNVTVDKTMADCK